MSSNEKLLFSLIILAIIPAFAYADNQTSSNVVNSTPSAGNNETKNVPIFYTFKQVEIVESLLISVAITSGIILTVYKIVIRNKKSESEKTRWAFWNIIRDESWYPSLSLFQFFLWTIVILFSFLFLSFIRIEGGDLQSLGIQDPNLLYLMGISVTTPIVSGGLSSIKYKTIQRSVPPSPLPSYSTMLEENGSPSITRFQMFAWTFIGIIIYLVILFSIIPPMGVRTNVELLQLPQISPVLVVLMGLSQTAYLGGKSVAQIPKATLLPTKGKANDTVTIYGSAFGSKNKVLFVDSNGIAKEGDVPADKWTSTLITVTVPSNIAAGDHNVLIVTLTDIIGAGTFTVPP